MIFLQAPLKSTYVHMNDHYLTDWWKKRDYTFNIQAPEVHKVELPLLLAIIPSIT